jgi:tRNA pseudouridine55 synthase
MPTTPRPAATPHPVRPSLHGLLVVDKPAGWTSHDVVARARRLLGERRVGHAGTLDPAATGVLPLAVGAATRVLEYLAEASKTYLAEVTFGVETDSHDADGSLVAQADPAALTRDAVDATLPAFRGEIDQIPPMHAAIKVGGRRLYELAHRGEEIERAPRQVTIFALELVAWEPPVATLLVDCSKGTYVRALARDLGAAAGTGAHLSNLIRLRTGPFHLCQAITLAELAEAELPWAWPSLAAHPDAALQDHPALLLDEAATVAWRRGLPMPGTPVPDPVADAARSICRAYDADGAWLGVGTVDAAAGRWRPLKVVESAA